MASFNIKIKGLNEALKGIGKIESSIEPKMNKAITKSAEITKQNIAREAPVDLGTLKRAINKKVFRLKAIVGVGSEAAKYGFVMEFGRTSKRMPPVAPIEAWAARHGLPGLGFIIARSIAQKGTRPQPFFEPGVEKSIPGIVKIFNKEMDVIINI